MYQGLTGSIEIRPLVYILTSRLADILAMDESRVWQGTRVKHAIGLPLPCYVFTNMDPGPLGYRTNSRAR
jgi:hypothetical protein